MQRKCLEALWALMAPTQTLLWCSVLLSTVMIQLKMVLYPGCLIWFLMLLPPPLVRQHNEHLQRIRDQIEHWLNNKCTVSLNWRKCMESSSGKLVIAELNLVIVKAFEILVQSQDPMFQSPRMLLIATRFKIQMSCLSKTQPHQWCFCSERMYWYSVEEQIKKLACTEEPQCAYDSAVCRIGITIAWSCDIPTV